MRKKLKKLFKKLAKPISLTIINFILLAAIVIGNSRIQVFCVPTTWAFIVAVICLPITALSPILPKKGILATLFAFINGISFFIYLYCIFFLEQVNIYGLVAIIMFGFGLLTFIPHFFAIQLFLRNIKNAPSKYIEVSFLLGFVLFIGISIYAGVQYKEAIKQIQAFEKSGYTELEKNFFTEKIVGMHFIYHTKVCEWDGWRPPMHEPLMVIGMWLNGRVDPLNVDLKKRIELYSIFFPNKPIHYKCSCAREGSAQYHSEMGVYK